MYDISFENFSISEDVLWKIRKDIYHSEGTGFIVLRNFISDDLVSHLRLFGANLPSQTKPTDRYQLKVIFIMAAVVILPTQNSRKHILTHCGQIPLSQSLMR